MPPIKKPIRKPSSDKKVLVKITAPSKQNVYQKAQNRKKPSK